MNKKLVILEQEVNVIGMNTVKGPQNLELHKAQFEMLQKIKKSLHVIKEFMKNF